MVGKLPLKLWLQYECCSIVSHCLHVVPMKRNSTSWILKLFSYILVSFFYLVKHSKTKSYAFRSFFIMLRIPVFKIVCRELVFWTLLALLNWHLALFGIRFLWEISGLAFSWSLQGSQMVFFDGHWPFVPGNGTVFLVSKIGSPVDV